MDKSSPEHRTDKGLPGAFPILFSCFARLARYGPRSRSRNCVVIKLTLSHRLFPLSCCSWTLPSPKTPADADTVRRCRPTGARINAEKVGDSSCPEQRPSRTSEGQISGSLEGCTAASRTPRHVGAPTVWCRFVLYTDTSDHSDNINPPRFELHTPHICGGVCMRLQSICSMIRHTA